jgi:hypothetical protein
MGGPAEIRAQATADEEYVQTYYPNALDPTNAIQVDVASGAEVSGIDIRLVRAKTLQISGTVMDRTKSSIPVQVMLTRQDSSPANFPAMKRVMTDAKGRFVIRGVMPGAYTLQAVEFSDQQQRAALMQVTVGDSNLDGVQLTFGSPPEITGIFKIENSPQQAKDQQQTQAQAQQTESDAAPSRHVFLNPESNLPMYMGNGGEVKEDGTFTLKNIMPQKYRISVYPLDGDAYLKQVVIGDKETVDGRVDFSSGIDATQIKVVVSINGAHIEGSVKDDKQQTTPRATVVLVPSPTDATPRYKSASTDQNGHFVLRGIAPGKYKLYAFDQIDSGAFYDVDYMKPFDGKGETVDVSEGDRLTRDLTLIVNDEDGAQR